MKQFVKKLLEKLGFRLIFVKNLWYVDSFYLLKKISPKERPLIFDVGACDGSSVADFKRLFPESIVHSFEPYFSSYNNLVEFTKAVPGVFHYHMALSNKNGFTNFFVNKSKATNSLLTPKSTNSFIDEHIERENDIQVPVKTLDTFLTENNIGEIDILKIDVQGGELMVLEGAKIALENKQIKIIYCEVWFIEGYESQPLYHDIATFLTHYEYLPFGIYNMHYRHDGHFLWGDAIFYLKEKVK